VLNKPREAVGDGAARVAGSSALGTFSGHERERNRHTVKTLDDLQRWLLLLLASIVLLLEGCGGGDGPTRPDVTTTTTVLPSGSASFVRTLYVVPNDRDLRRDYANAVRDAMRDLQSWYRDQLSGRSFVLFTNEPEECRLPRAADYYAVDTWQKVLDDVQVCAPVARGARDTVWVLYVDVVHACNTPGRLGAGTQGLVMLPRQDMDGLIGARYLDDCGREYRLPPSRYVGGLGHELGHGFGLPHPPGCDEGSAICDQNSLMWLGYVNYPATYLRPEEKEYLLRLSFFN
jgi:hypothetical protein